MHIADRIIDFLRIPAQMIRPCPKNWRTHPNGQMDALRSLLARFGKLSGVCVIQMGDGTYTTEGTIEEKNRRHTGTGTFMLMDGHARTDILANDPMVPCQVLDLSMAELEAALLAFDAVGDMATADVGKLELLIAENPFADSPAVQQMLAELLAEHKPAEPAPAGDATPPKSLAERFGVPPFSVLDARQGYCQDRKRAWLALGIQSELGRGGGQGMNTHSPSISRNPDGSLNYGTPLGVQPGAGDDAARMAMHNDPMQRKTAYDAATGG